MNRYLQNMTPESRKYLYGDKVGLSAPKPFWKSDGIVLFCGLICLGVVICLIGAAHIQNFERTAQTAMEWSK